MTTFKNTAIALILLATLGIALWTSLLSYQQSARPAASAGDSLPDAFMEEVTAVIMDTQGKPRMKIVTPKMVHYLKQDMTQLETPQLTLYRKSPQPWYVTSKTATATDGIENVVFNDNVVIHRPADQNTPATLIQTPTLTVYPAKQLAETSAVIKLIQPNIIIKAIGMHADMNTGDIKLLSEAQGEYVPE